MEIKIGQRWLWNNPGEEFIVEIASSDKNRFGEYPCICVQVLTDKSIGWIVGNKGSFAIDHPSISKNWMLLEGQDKP